jgi:hypothetical protein
MTTEATAEAPAPAISGRLVRSCLRYLRERVGAATLTALAKEFPEHAFLRAAHVDDGWIALDGWLAVLRTLETRFGDPATQRLLREMTRATMAAAVSTVWGTFLADATPEQLLDRAGDLYGVSFSRGRLAVVERGNGRAVLAVEDWPSPPPEVGAMVAEACAVFLARLGKRAPRVVDSVVSGRLTIEGAW